MKKTLLWVGLLIAFIAIYMFGYLAYHHFFRDKIQQNSEKRININIAKNYHSKKSAFNELIAYTSHLNSFPSITFLEDKNISCTLSNIVHIDTSYTDISFFTEFDPRAKNIRLLDEQVVQLQFPDTTITVPRWIWYFEGSKDIPGYDVVLDVLNIHEHQLDSLRTLLKNVDCEAIGIEDTGDIHLRFDGFEMCQYEYVISKDFNYDGYTQIDDNIYYGLNRSPLFCGNMIWNK